MKINALKGATLAAAKEELAAVNARINALIVPTALRFVEGAHSDKVIDDSAQVAAIVEKMRTAEVQQVPAPEDAPPPTPLNNPIFQHFFDSDFELPIASIIKDARTAPPLPAQGARAASHLSGPPHPQMAAHQRIVIVSDPLEHKDDPRRVALARPTSAPSKKDARGLHGPGISLINLGKENTGSEPQEGDEQLIAREVVIGANGQPRQAGATTPEGEFIKRYKKRAEESLFIFIKGVLGRFFLTPHFHKDICRFIQSCPPYRKMILMPREHAKTTIVAGGLPPHILIQPAASNIYFPGMEGNECRILMAGETAGMAQKNLRVVKSIFMENRLFRAFWPDRCWENERAAGQWNNEGIIIPRKNEWPDPTIRAIGVGGAVTGGRPNVMIKDDLVTLDAANSELVMDEAIQWHIASRALLDTYELESGLTSLEFIIGTRWAVYDLYSYIIDNDPSVQVNDDRFHRIIRDGNILWPEKYSLQMIEQLQREHGSNFHLMYLNSAADPELTDFSMESVRDFNFVNGEVVFEEDARDAMLIKRGDLKARVEAGEMPPVVMKRGEALNAMIMKRIAESGQRVRMRA